jgi:hypothetical protein
MITGIVTVTVSHSHRHSHSHSHSHSQSQSRSHSHSHSHSQPQPQSQSQSHTVTCTPAHQHTHTHTHADRSRIRPHTNHRGSSMGPAQHLRTPSLTRCQRQPHQPLRRQRVALRRVKRRNGHMQAADRGGSRHIIVARVGRHGHGVGARSLLSRNGAVS